jgi:hypothetical protein
MGRMHSNGKGMSASALPYKRSPPSWCKTTSTEVTDLICKLARKGMTPSSIGVKLRDEQGIPQVHYGGAVVSSMSMGRLWASCKPKSFGGLHSCTWHSLAAGQVHHWRQDPPHPEGCRSGS